MTRNTKAQVIAVTGYILTLLAYSFLAAFIAAALGVPPVLTMVLNFLIVFGFCMSPWYHRYMDWIEDLALKALPEDKNV